MQKLFIVILKNLCPFSTLRFSWVYVGACPEVKCDMAVNQQDPRSI